MLCWSMKAWTDIIKEHTPYNTNDTEYFIDMGVKIERFQDGTFRIFNVMTSKHKFEEVTAEQYDVFERKGFKPGAYRVVMDYLCDDVARCKFDDKKRKRIIEQYLEFKKKYINFVQI